MSNTLEIQVTNMGKSSAIPLNAKSSVFLALCEDTWTENIK